MVNAAEMPHYCVKGIPCAGEQPVEVIPRRRDIVHRLDM